MSKESVRKISMQDIGTRKLAAEVVPQNLMREQRARYLTLWNDIKKIAFSTPCTHSRHKTKRLLWNKYGSVHYYF
jgi:hypothetical protein